MFDKLRNKFDTRRRTSTISDTSTLNMDIPTIIEPRKSTSSAPPPSPSSYMSRRTSRSSTPDPRRLSAPASDAGEVKSIVDSRRLSQGSEPTITRVATPPAKLQGRRKRDIFWRDSLWDESSAPPRGSMIRASSQSVDFMHPEVAEEKMRQMPYYNWRG